MPSMLKMYQISYSKKQSNFFFKYNFHTWTCFREYSNSTRPKYIYELETGCLELECKGKNKSGTLYIFSSFFKGFFGIFFSYIYNPQTFCLFQKTISYSRQRCCPMALLVLSMCNYSNCYDESFDVTVRECIQQLVIHLIG